MSARNLIGLILIILGVGFIISEVLNYPYDTLLAQWWPIFVVLIGLNQLFRFPDRPTLPILVTLFGFVLLARTLDFLPVNFWHYIGALVLILLGLWILLPHHQRRTTTTETGGTEVVSIEDHVDETVIFGAMRLQNNSPRFHGGSISATASGVELDLRGATLAQDGAVLDVAAFGGSIVIWVSKNWPVTLAGSPLIGVCRSEVPTEAFTAEKPMLAVRCSGILGSVEVRN